MEAGEFEIVLERGRVARGYWAELWRYRGLFLTLAWRDIAVRYKQTVAGAAWAIGQPTLNVAAMTIVFGVIAGLPSQSGAPYALMVLAGLLPWQFFSQILLSGSQSIVNNASLISKVYFPRLIIPASAVAVALVDFLASCIVFAGLMAWYQFWPTWRLLALPLLALAAIFAALGPGLVFSALAVRYRDFRFIVPFVLQLGLYLSPVAYSSLLVHEKLGETGFLLYSLNPVVGVVDGFRWALIGTTPPSASAMLVSATVAVVLFVAGVVYFRSTERAFADAI